MNNKGILLLISVFFMALFLHACLTTGDRVNMEEFKRQLEAGGQAMDVTQTAQAKAAVEEYGSSAEPETKTAVAALQEMEPNEQPSTAKTAEPAAPPPLIVKTAVVKTEKQPVAENKAKIQLKEEKTAESVPKTAPDNFKWILVQVFTAAFAVFCLIAFILSRKKKEDDDEETAAPLKPQDFKPAYTAPEKAIEEYRETAVLKPEPVKPAFKPESQFKPEPVQESLPEEKQPEPDNYVEPVSVEPVPPLPPAVPLPEKQLQYGEGIAGISPTQFGAGTQGNAVHLLYKVGEDSPEYRTIKITVPDGWSRPGTVNTDEGYFTATVNGGRLISTAAENMSMVITVHGLPAVRGEVAVVFGERRGGSPGVKVQLQPGEAVFKIETEGRGATELKEILDSPVVEVN
jgi:hypothetical protein